MAPKTRSQTQLELSKKLEDVYKDERTGKWVLFPTKLGVGVSKMYVPGERVLLFSMCLENRMPTLVQQIILTNYRICFLCPIVGAGLRLSNISLWNPTLRV